MQRIIGRQPVITAIQSGAALERVYIQDSLTGDFEKQVRALCKEKEIPLNRIPRIKLDREIKGNHQGIYALMSQVTYVDFEELIGQLLDEKTNPVLVLLDGVLDVRNIGAIARSAEVFGAHGLVLPTKKTAAINEVAVKTSAGALLHLPLSRVKNLQVALDLLGAKGFVVLGADAGASETLDDLTLDQPLAIIMGAEGKGIDRHLKIYCDHLFAISQAGKIDSLNVSVANGIILYEIFKQRKKSSQ